MSPERLIGKRILMVIAPDNFRDEEYSYPRRILENEGARITVCSSTTRECRGMLGLKVSPQIPIRAVRTDDYDAMVVVGGTGSKEYLWEDEDLQETIRAAFAKGKLIASICLSGAVLARAGILKGRKATVFKSELSLFELENGGAVYTAGPVVVDGKLITADGPRAAKAFAAAILEQLCAEDKE